MSQSATTESLPQAFEVIKRMQDQGYDWGEDYRCAGRDALADILESARSTQALRGFIEASAFSTLIRQRPPTPSCRGLSPYCGENSEPGRYSMESLTFNPELENSFGSFP